MEKETYSITICHGNNDIISGEDLTLKEMEKIRDDIIDYIKDNDVLYITIKETFYAFPTKDFRKMVIEKE